MGARVGIRSFPPAQTAHEKLKQWKPELEEETTVEVERQAIAAALAAKAAKEEEERKGEEEGRQSMNVGVTSIHCHCNRLARK